MGAAFGEGIVVSDDEWALIGPLKDLLREKLTWSGDRYAAVEKLMTDRLRAPCPQAGRYTIRDSPKNLADLIAC